MTEKETYTPLEKSFLWKDLMEKTDQYWRISPTKLHGIANRALGYSAGYGWTKGVMSSDITPATVFDPPFKASSSGGKIAPEENPLFALIPEVPQGQFLKELSDETVGTPDERENCDRKAPPILAGASNACLMPGNADVHHLSAIMMVLKHLYLHPDRLSEYDCSKEEQKVAVREALNTGFAIISRRSIEENFAKSCAEFEKKIPFLTTFQEKYVQDQEQGYQIHLAFLNSLNKASSLSPEEKKKLLNDWKLI